MPVRDWIYPLSSRSGFCFVLPDGTETEDTSPANFERTIRRPEPGRWVLATGFHQLQRGDRVWVYYGHADGNRGIVGLGIVERVDKETEPRPVVHLRWQRQATRRLLMRPVPAEAVRKHCWPRACRSRGDGLQAAPATAPGTGGPGR